MAGWRGAMAQFRGRVQGGRGMASRLGSKNSGLWVAASRWVTGMRVEASHRNGEEDHHD